MPFRLLMAQFDSEVAARAANHIETVEPINRFAPDASRGIYCCAAQRYATDFVRDCPNRFDCAGLPLDFTTDSRQFAPEFSQFIPNL